MALLEWNKPPKVQSIEEWKSISADGAPPGVYTPNMSHQDSLKWRAKLVRKTTDKPAVEIRVTLQCQVLIIVCLAGFGQLPNSKIPIVKISQNASSFWTADDLQKFNQAIEEATEVLRQLESSKSSK